MVLPILIVPWMAQDPCMGSWREKGQGRGQKRGLLYRDEVTGRWLAEENLRKTNPRDYSVPGPRVRNKLISNVPLERCEVISKSVLKRWRLAQQGMWARVSRLARSCDDALMVEPAKGDAKAIGWMLLAMFWRGCSHPSSLLKLAVHPFMGLLKWMLKAPTAQVTVEDRSRLPQKVMAVLRRLRRRAKKLTKALLAERSALGV